jgi:Ca-activated chloride channel family protein
MRFLLFVLCAASAAVVGCYAYDGDRSGRPYRLPDSGGAGAPAGSPAATLSEGPPPPVNGGETAQPEVPASDSFAKIEENGFLAVKQHPLSTFSVDVDTASYAIVRRCLTQNTLPPRDAVRIEELINYFPYDYSPPVGEAPFAANVEVNECPWHREHRLVRLALKGRVVPARERPSCNLVFLIDVSGSMAEAKRLPLVKSALALLVEKLGERDQVAIVTYAGTSGLALPSTPCSQKRKILSAIDRLRADGSTNGGEGIQLAYRTAVQHFKPAGVNRIILCTDGDFNVGVTDPGALVRMIEEKARSGVALSVLGFGMDNLKDATMEQLADKGNGNYAYIDTLQEARKVLVEQLSGTLVTIAKDVKIQVEFNPAQVEAYRLIGYENRLLQAQDFNNDKTDAGEIGAGHAVTALYEVVPSDWSPGRPGVDALKYQRSAKPAGEVSRELLTLKVRHKEPNGTTSRLDQFAVTDSGETLSSASGDFKFAAAVAAFGMLLRDSPHKGEITFDGVRELARSGKGRDPWGYRGEFLDLVHMAKELQR